MIEGTVSAGYAAALVEFAISRGADGRTLIQRSGISPSTLGDPDERVPLANYLELFAAGIELANEPALALQFGEAVRMQDLSIVGLICEACETAAEVGPMLNRYARLVVDDGVGEPPDLIRAVRDDDGLWMEFPNHAFANNPHIAEAEMARLVCNARAMFSSTPFFQSRPFPRAVRFMHDAPAYRSEYERIFKAPITFNSDRNALLTDEEFMLLKQPPKNRYVFGVLSEKVEALLQKLESSKTFRGQIEVIAHPFKLTGAADSRQGLVGWRRGRRGCVAWRSQ